MSKKENKSEIFKRFFSELPNNRKNSQFAEDKNPNVKDEEDGNLPKPIFKKLDFKEDSSRSEEEYFGKHLPSKIDIANFITLIK